MDVPVTAATPPRSMATRGEDRRAPQGCDWEAWAAAPERARRARPALLLAAVAVDDVGVEVEVVGSNRWNRFRDFAAPPSRALCAMRQSRCGAGIF